MSYRPVYLKKNEERRILSGHPWVYSNEIDTQRSSLKMFTPGETVLIVSSKDKSLAIGYINPHALICVRVLATDPADLIDEQFFARKIAAALALRERFLVAPYYRLVFGDSDYLSGLIIDRYDQVLVVQTNTAGMENFKPMIVTALQSLCSPKTIVFKNDSQMRTMEGLEKYVAIEFGEEIANTTVKENGSVFTIPILEGQKTGWFYDHRDNRLRLNKYVRDKKVLDVFSYVGGWGIQAARAGAREVLCIDSSAKAISFAKENAKLNECAAKIDYCEEDAFVALKKLHESTRKFDVIILDPPALIKKRKDFDQGIIAYLRLNELAMNLLNTDGILVSCSCSLHLTQENLVDIIRRASLKTHRNVKILETGFAAIDHPIHPAVPETAYLKAIFCWVG